MSLTEDGQVQVLSGKIFLGWVGAKVCPVQVFGAAWDRIETAWYWAGAGIGSRAGSGVRREGGRSCGYNELLWPAGAGDKVLSCCSRALSWMEACLKEELPSPVELEESLRNGVLLAKLGHCFAPSVVPLKKIYDVEQLRYQVRNTGLYFLPCSSQIYLCPQSCESRVTVLIHQDSSEGERGHY